jgi:hypothetical protein
MPITSASITSGRCCRCVPVSASTADATVQHRVDDAFEVRVVKVTDGT